MPAPLGDLLCEAIRIKAGQFSLPEALVRAICIHEPGESATEAARWCASRFELDYAWLWDCANDKPYPHHKLRQSSACSAPADFSAPKGLILSRHTEFVQQKTSWGPMQVMGAVAREMGFNGYFPELCSPLGLYYACKHLRRLADRFLASHGWDGVAAAYNAGSPRKGADGRWVNQGYVDKLRAAGCDFRVL